MAWRGPRGSNSVVKRSRALVPTRSVAHLQARCSRASRVPEPGVVAPQDSSAGGVGMNGVVAVLCMFADYVSQGGEGMDLLGAVGAKGLIATGGAKAK
jgi:hypothetical protein